MRARPRIGATLAAMQRLHLIEFEDLDAVPRAIRDGGTDLLDLAFTRMGFYAGAAPELASLLERAGTDTLVDLCSGGGGGTLALWRELAEPRPQLVLSDRNPNRAGMARVAAMADARVRYRQESVDAMGGGGELAGIRTMSGALHHFPPDAVRTLLTGIVARGAPLAFFDVAASPAMRRAPIVVLPLAMAVNMVVLMIASLLLVPLVRPLSLSRVLLTYVVPLIPLLVAWDGTVSALRAYTPDELLALAHGVPGAERYRFHAGVHGRALYLTGIPQ